MLTIYSDQLSGSLALQGLVNPDSGSLSHVETGGSYLTPKKLCSCRETKETLK